MPKLNLMTSPPARLAVFLTLALSLWSCLRDTKNATPNGPEPESSSSELIEPMSSMEIPFSSSEVFPSSSSVEVASSSSDAMSSSSEEVDTTLQIKDDSSETTPIRLEFTDATCTSLGKEPIVKWTANSGSLVMNSEIFNGSIPPERIAIGIHQAYHFSNHLIAKAYDTISINPTPWKGFAFWPYEEGLYGTLYQADSCGARTPKANWDIQIQRPDIGCNPCRKRTNSQGQFAFKITQPGIHEMMWEVEIPVQFPIPYTWELTHICKDTISVLPAGMDLLWVTEEDYHGIPDGAPNIYLYPTTTTDVSVRLDIQKPHRLLVSEPEYNEGWNVRVEPNGTIDGRYPFLFYEAEVFPQLQRDSGWVVQGGAQLEQDLTDMLQQHGLRGREITDFLDYWLAKLPNKPWFFISPQNPEIVGLHIEPRPDKLQRLLWLIEPMDYPVAVPEPKVEIPDRDGFFAVEWGALIDWQYFGQPH